MLKWFMGIGGDGNYLGAKWYIAIIAAVVYGILGLAFILGGLWFFLFVMYKLFLFLSFTGAH